MLEATVQMPVALLGNRLDPSAKLVWLVLRAAALERLGRPGGESRQAKVPGPSRLGAGSALSRQTAARALALLSDSEWYQEGRSPGAPAVTFPVDLLPEIDVGVRAKLLYGWLQLTAGFKRPSGQFRYIELSTLAGMSLNTVKAGVKELQDSGWLRTEQKHKHAPVCFELTNPLALEGQGQAERAKRRVDRARFRGEAIMREILNLLVDSADYEDNAEPSFLVNPLTEERMQLDRYYRSAGVALEFNGPQHYGPTGRFSAREAAQQRARDLMKAALCAENGVRLLVVVAADLSLKAIRQKVEGVLPLRSLKGKEEAVGVLEEMGRRYRKAAEKKSRPERAKAR